MLKERQLELLHVQLVNDLEVAAAEIVSRVGAGPIGIGPARTCLGDAETFLAEAGASLTKARKLVVQELKHNVAWAMQLCEEARNNGGYVASDTTKEDGTPMRALVKLPELQAHLDCEHLLEHSIWKSTSVPPAELAQWQTHRKMSGFMYRVLAFNLVSMPAYENIGLELPSDGLWPDWESLHE